MSELAGKGNLQNVDLQIQDICQTSLPGLPLDATASLLGKLDNNVSPEDLALGLMHMVLQSIGQAAVLSALEMGIRDFVLIGNLTQLPQCRPVFDTIAQMYDVRFIIPANAEYQTAIGAALAYIKKNRNNSGKVMGLIGLVSIGESCVSVISAAGCQPSGKPGFPTGLVPSVHPCQPRTVR